MSADLERAAAEYRAAYRKSRDARAAHLAAIATTEEARIASERAANEAFDAMGILSRVASGMSYERALHPNTAEGARTDEDQRSA